MNMRSSKALASFTLLTIFLLWNPQNLVLFLFRAARQRLQLLQSAHPPVRKEGQEAQLTRLQHLMRVEQRFEKLLMRGDQTSLQRLGFPRLALQFFELESDFFLSRLRRSTQRRIEPHNLFFQARKHSIAFIQRFIEVFPKPRRYAR